MLCADGCHGEWLRGSTKCYDCDDYCKHNQVGRFAKMMWEKVVADIVIKCDNENCGDEIKYKDLEDHKSSCVFGVRKCEHAGCNFTDYNDKIEKHEEKCDHRPVKCEHCSRSFSSIEVTKHEETCSEKLVGCRNARCNATVRLRNLAYHEGVTCHFLKRAY